MDTDKDDRAEILSIASAMTTNREDAARVVKTAGPLAAWVEDARTTGDMIARMDALRQHRRNTAADGVALADAVMDKPDVFVAGAAVLHGFMIAHEATLEIPEWIDDEEAGAIDGEEADADRVE